MGASPDPLLRLETVERLPVEGESFLLHLGGERHETVADDDAITLVVEIDGSRHHFPALAQPHRPRLDRPRSWSASFALPSWLARRLPADVILNVGGSEIPVALGPALSAAGDGAAEAPSPRLVPEAEAVAALRAELRQRAETEAALRGQVARLEAELRARADNQARLGAAQQELRGELDELARLVDAAQTQRQEVESRALALAGRVAELEQELANADVAREAAVAEATALRDEIERLGGELGQAPLESEDEVSEARALIEEARALRAQILGAQ